MSVGNVYFLTFQSCFALAFTVDFVEFTDEEGYGKYVDLHEIYDKFLNLRGVEVRLNWMSMRIRIKI